MSTTAIQVSLLTLNSDDYRHEPAKDVSEHPRVPAPTYRHAAPSAPWPWMDFDMDSSKVQPLVTHGSADSTEERWEKYPQSLFGNWTPDQVSRSKMLLNCNSVEPCSIHRMDILDGGKFDKAGEGRTVHVKADPASTNAFWESLQIPRPPNVRVQGLFVENMTSDVLQMLGTKYNIEPFFFSSSANWIPSRYQEDPKPGEGDHITVVLPFIRAMKNRRPITRARVISEQTDITPPTLEKQSGPLEGMCRFYFSRAMSNFDSEEKQVIDTQVPLLLPNDKLLLQDLLAIHMVRTTTTSTIISYHPHSELQRASSKCLHSLVQRTGDSVYWSKIFANSRDPTFVFLAILWYALYAWDEAFEILYQYINMLESRVLTTNNLNHTQELHKLQAHLLYYQQLLQDFRKSVVFVQDTPNPAMGAKFVTDKERNTTTDLMDKEAKNLVSEIDRLEGQRATQSARLKNVMDLAFSTVNIEDSRAMQGLTVATMGDSAGMKQISYLTMVFLPASFIASIFGMNVAEITPNTHASMAHYVEATIGLTLLTAWLVMALHKHSSLHPAECHFVRRLAWPIFFSYEMDGISIQIYDRPYLWKPALEHGAKY
ncbi:hypothetical protein PAXRUDRAFT_30370 [Paxillus rubicundulus Ve08.2h10]|uniref:Uncharacterized protein n=1 Tax=Paxillus rubicundulus Ve08.2h10 TaxID=930991 RepID=A0A0D0ECN1_9AGAM|nr:hypothetical protein PAXRUDRAFT_30370 [Paxillus rubicundulus Ve08.2h10]